MSVATCKLWPPACTAQLFKQTYLPAIEAGKVGRFGLFTLTDKAEQDCTCAYLYNKTLLHLVSHAFEVTARIPLIQPNREGKFGMSKFVDKDADLQALFKKARADWITPPNNEPLGSRSASTARHHGDNDNDTVQATLARISAKSDFKVTPSFTGTNLSHRTRRSYITNASK